jgi:hypothetical protein
MVTLFALVLAAAPPPTTAPPRNVYVGVHLNDVSDFDLKAGRFKADVVVWVKWLGTDDAPALTFPNAEIGQTDDLGIEVEGHWHAKRWRLQGTFRGDFPVHDFPFDEQSLRITFALQSSEGVLVPDLAASGMSTAFSITGWNYEPYFSASATERVLGSDLGSVSHEGQNAHQRLVTYAVELSRPFGPYLVKFALPLVLILLVSLLALFLSRNPHLATTPPAIERIDVTAMAPLDAAHALLDGRLDIVTALTPDALELLQKDSRAQVLEQPGDQAWMLVPRLSEGPFADVEARRALLAAIDRPGLVKALAPLPTHVADGWSTDGCERGPDCPSPPPAKSLAELGLVGTEVRLTVPTIRSKDATHAVLTERLVFDLTRAGLTVQVVEKSPTELRAAIAQGTHEGLSLLSRDSGDPGRFMNVPGEAGRALDRPFGAHFDAELLSRLTRFRSTLYAERRDELEAELQAAWFVRLPMLPLLVSSRVAAVRADLLGPRWGKADSLWWNIGEWHVAPNAGPSER